MQILPEPMNILHVSVQIPEDPEPVQIPVSQVPQPPMQILPEPMNILHVPVQIPVSHVPQPPMQVLHVSESVQIPVSHVPHAGSTCIRTCADSSVTRPTYAESPRTCADSSVTRPTCAESPRTYAASPRARHVGPFGVDRCIRPAHVVCIWTPRTPAASHGTLYF
ncbi:hypothetical protein TNCV_1905351 [Trichonephila clavipes]|nr:hypothetical protein TNCV_1905351 [Trichonephila clavipes]